MKSFAGVLAAMAAVWLGTATAGADLATAPWSAPVCTAGPQGDRPSGNDMDQDGVPDSEDWCVHTPAGARVGANGCAAGEIEVSCGRGVAEPAPRVVPPVGAPVVARGMRDTDGDGVADSDDKCGGTPKGAEVDDNGCVRIEKVVLKGVNFATGSAKLLPAAGDTLKSVAAAMKANKKLEVEVDGYTDSVGDEAKNQGLSERRAKSVKAFLVKEGVEEGRLSTKGFGEANPVDSNDTAEGRANNRRVSFKVTNS